MYLRVGPLILTLEDEFIKIYLEAKYFMTISLLIKPIRVLKNH